MKNFRRHKPKFNPPRDADERERPDARKDDRRGAAPPRNEASGREASRSETGRSEAGRSEFRRNEVRRDAERMTKAQRARGETAAASGGGREVRADAARETTAQRVERPADESHLYGVLPVVEALRAGSRRIERITIAEGAGGARLAELFELAREFRVPVRRVARAELQRLAASGANHQGVVAHVAAVAYADAGELMDALTARVGTNDPPLAVVLDGVEDPRNLGAIIRTAECAGVHGLFVPERRAAGLTETVAKTAAGALEYLPVAHATNIARLVEEFKERGIWTIGTDAEANIAYTDWDWQQPCALLLGGEGAGLRRLVRERCDALVRIPLRGRISSLNVSVAAAVVLYEAVRQRTAAPPATYVEGRDDAEE
jgi:23S rRNA (guanosine2251-2'-O)-methyltransferase